MPVAVEEEAKSEKQEIKMPLVTIESNEPYVLDASKITGHKYEIIEPMKKSHITDSFEGSYWMNGEPVTGKLPKTNIS